MQSMLSEHCEGHLINYLPQVSIKPGFPGPRKVELSPVFSYRAAREACWLGRGQNRECVGWGLLPHS